MLGWMWTTSCKRTMERTSISWWVATDDGSRILATCGVAGAAAEYSPGARVRSVVCGPGPASGPGSGLRFPGGWRRMTDPAYSLDLRTPPLDLPDFYGSMSAMNRASLVSLAQDNVIPSGLATRIARAIDDIDTREAEPGARRSQDYLDFERNLIAIAGPEATW